MISLYALSVCFIYVFIFIFILIDSRIIVVVVMYCMSLLKAISFLVLDVVHMFLCSSEACYGLR